MSRLELRPYPTYKESGVEWIGRVPVNWDVSALRHRYSQCLGKMLDSKRNTGSNQLPYLRNTDVQWDRINIDDLPTMEIPRHEYDRYTVQIGDLLVCEGGEVGRCALWSGDLAKCGFQKALHRLRPRNTKHDLARYMYYALSVASNRQALNDGHLSTIAHLTGEKLRKHPFPFPSCAEQAAIARFLDHADERIQSYIRAKQKLIALLEEQKQAVIRRAVTGRIDLRTDQPYSAYKPSGVDWLGEVPAHWDLSPLKRISCRWQNGATPPTSEVVFYENGTVPWYGPYSCGTKEEVASPVRHLSRAAFSSGGARLIQGPALLIVVIGATAGRMTLMPNDGSTNQQITAFEISPDRVDPRFILRQARGAESWLRSTASSATIPILDSGVVGRLLCAVPPLVEQTIITRSIDHEVERIDQLVERTLNEVHLFREYRIRLMADVVTGKLDVREAVAGLTKADSLGAEDDAADSVDHDADRSETTRS